jgi:hypothetical protein
MTAAEVDAWFEKYENPMKPVVQAIRRVVLEADPRIDEVIKWQAPTFVYKGNLASFYPKSKQHASLMFHLGAKTPGEFPSMEGSGDTSRVMKFADLADVERKTDELERIVRAWIESRYLTSTSSTSKISVEFGGMSP